MPLGVQTNHHNSNKQTNIIHDCCNKSLIDAYHNKLERTQHPSSKLIS